MKRKCKFQSFCNGTFTWAKSDFSYTGTEIAINRKHGGDLLCCHKCGSHRWDWELRFPFNDYYRLCPRCAPLPSGHDRNDKHKKIKYLADIELMVLDLSKKLRLFRIEQNKRQK